MKIDDPDMSESMARPIWKAMTMPVKKSVIAVTGIDLYPISSIWMMTFFASKGGRNIHTDGVAEKEAVAPDPLEHREGRVPVLH